MRWWGLIAVLVASQAAATPGDVVRVEHRDPAALPSRGPSNAPVTIELFFSPGPPASRLGPYKMLEKLQADHPTRIRLVYRILDGGSRLHFAALEAYAEGKFFEFMDELNKSRTPLTDPQLIEVAKKVGVDPSRLVAAIHHAPPAYEQTVQANRRRLRRRIRNPQTLNALFNGRPPQTQLGALGASDLEREYTRALTDATELLDRGADPRSLVAASEGDEPANPQDIVIQPGQTDVELETPPADPPLATPPLALRGLPSYGPADAAVTIVVACSPISPTCDQPSRAASVTADLYPDDVRVVWAPFFDVGQDDAADLSLLADAALCAEQVGTSSEADIGSASAGWIWVEVMRAETRSRRRRLETDQLIDKVAGKLGVDRRAFATCRARTAGTAVAWIEAARHAGMRVSPSTVVGGRIYPPITEPNTVQQLVEAELAPGNCDGCIHLGAFAPSWRRTPE